MEDRWLDGVDVAEGASGGVVFEEGNEVCRFVRTSLWPSQTPGNNSLPEPGAVMKTISARQSSCLCGAVKFDVVGNPLSFMVCHCRNCQKSTGTAFASNTFFKVKDVHVKQGKDKIKDYEDRATASGNTIIRSFCEQCGSSIFLRTPGSDILGVTLGAVDDAHDWVPRREIFQDTKKPWVKELKTQGKVKL